MSGFNSTDSYRTTRENVMKAFDKLPRDVRMALAEAPQNWVPQPYVTRIRRGWSVAKCVESIRRASAAFITKSNEKRGL